MKKTALLLAVLLLAAGCGGESKIQEAYDFCSEDTRLSDVVELGDGGSSASLSLSDDADEDLNLAGACFLRKLGVSDALMDDMGNTTAMMGRQKESENGLTYRWTYHPDNGFEMTVRED